MGANVMFCGTSMKDRQFVVAMNENSNDPNNKLEKGFRVFVPAEGSLSRINTPAIEKGKTYHLDVAVDQYTFVILQDGVVVHEDFDYSEHETRDSVPCRAILEIRTGIMRIMTRMLLSAILLSKMKWKYHVMSIVIVRLSFHSVSPKVNPLAL